MSASYSASSHIITLPVFVFLLWWSQTLRSAGRKDLCRSSSPSSCSEQGQL